MEHLCFHPTPLRRLCLRAAEHGLDVDALLRPAGLGWAELQQREHLLGFDEGQRVIQTVQAAIGDPMLALKLGRATQLIDHGSLGLLMASSANLREALLAFHHFSRLRPAAVHITLRLEDGGAWVEGSSRLALGDIRAFVFDHLAGSLSRIFSSISHSTLDDVHLELPWSPPSWRNAYHALAGSLQFSAQRLRFWLPASLLERPCATASPSHFQEIWRLCELQTQRLQVTPTLVTRVRQTLQTCESDWPDEARMAQGLGLSRSTLVRRLKSENNSYRALTEEARRQRAARQLRFSGQSVGEIARSLGYTSESNFSRAFKRWTGQSPHSFRHDPAGETL